MVEKTFEEFNARNRFCFLLVAVFAVAPAKSNMGFGYFQNPRIGDGHPVGVTAKVFHYTFSRAKCLFGINDF